MLFSRNLFVSAFAVAAWPLVTAQNLTSDQIALVEARLADGAKTSWELGIRTQAILELNAPDYSATSNHTLPPSTSVNASEVDSLGAVFTIAHNVVANRTISNGNITGPQPLVNDTSAGDPASLGMAVLLASWTQQYKGDGLDYTGAAEDQLNYLFDVVPHTEDGAISHIVKDVELWADSVYMVPPFLAYFGMIFQNQSIVYEAYNQISLYRSYLRDNRTQGGGLWRHVLMGPNEDVGHWSTGNAWAAAGMLRVLGTIRNSQYNSSMLSEQQDLINWISEIHNGMYANLDANFVFRNYADQPLSATNFYDASSTALLASTVYRLALFSNVTTYIPYADKSRLALGVPAPSGAPSSSSSSSSALSSSPGVSSVQTTGASSASASKATGVTTVPASKATSVASVPASKAKRLATSSSSSSSSHSSAPASSSSTHISAPANGTATQTVIPPSTPSVSTPPPVLSTTIIVSGKSTITSVITEPAAASSTVSTPPAPTYCPTSVLNLTAPATATVTGSTLPNATAPVATGPGGCILPPVVTTTVTYTPPSAPTPTVTDAPGTLAHFTADGWLTPVVDPYQYQYQGNESPEAQAFVMLMQAAYGDWAKALAQSQNATLTSHKSGAGRSAGAGVGKGWVGAGAVGVGMLLHWTLL